MKGGQKEFLFRQKLLLTTDHRCNFVIVGGGGPPISQVQIMHSLIVCICVAFLHYDFSNVPSDGPHKKMQSRNCCICVAFLHCAFSNVPSDGLHKKMPSLNFCICVAFLHCACSNVTSDGQHKKMHSRNCCINVAFLHCAFSNVLSDGLPNNMHSCIGCIFFNFSPIFNIIQKIFLLPSEFLCESSNIVSYHLHIMYIIYTISGTKNYPSSRRTCQ